MNKTRVRINITPLLALLIATVTFAQTNDNRECAAALDPTSVRENNDSTAQYSRLIQQLAVGSHALSIEALRTIAQSELPVNPVQDLTGLDAERRHAIGRAFDRLLKAKDAIDWDAIREYLAFLIAKETGETIKRERAKVDTESIFSAIKRPTIELPLDISTAQIYQRKDFTGPNRYTGVVRGSTLEIINLEARTVMEHKSFRMIGDLLHELPDGRVVFTSTSNDIVKLVDADSGAETVLATLRDIPEYGALYMSPGSASPAPPHIFVAQTSPGTFSIVAACRTLQVAIRIDPATKRTTPVELPHFGSKSNAQIVATASRLLAVHTDVIDGMPVLKVIDLAAESDVNGTAAGKLIYSMTFNDMEATENNNLDSKVYELPNGHVLIDVNKPRLKEADRYLIDVTEGVYKRTELPPGGSEEHLRPFMNPVTGNIETIIAAEIDSVARDKNVTLTLHIANLDSLHKSTLSPKVEVRKLQSTLPIQIARPINQSMPRITTTREKAFLYFGEPWAGFSRGYIVDLETGELASIASSVDGHLLWSIYANPAGHVISFWGPQRSVSKTLEQIQVFGPIAK